MKIKHKKLAASGTAIVLAGVLGIGALLQTSVSVQASSVMMPGIEEIVNDTAGSSEPFKILEIVDKKEEAELGYYVSGQEPYIKLYEYHYQNSDGNEQMMTFETLDDGLSKLPEKERYEFAQNVKLNDDGSINTDESTGIKNVQNVSYIEGSSQEKEEDYPLSYTPYQEKYFLGTDDNEKEWTKVNFVDADNKSRTDTVSLEGSYQENSSGKGNYTKEEQVYYPIRSDKTDDQNRPNKYRENIENFYYSDSDTAQAPYFLEFEPVANELVNDAIDQKKQDAVIGSEYDYNEGKYGYYENVYADLTEEILNNIEGKTYTFPGENPSKPDNFDKNSLPIQSNTSTQSDAFSEGEEGEFSSVNETAAATATGTTDFGNGQDNEFGDGSFSSGEEGGIDESVSSADSSAIQSDSAPQTTDSSEPSATDDISDGAQSTGNTAEQALGDIGDKENQGKQSDPYIYLSENIDKYPYYKYTLLGDLSYVKNKVQECKNNDADAQANQTEITRTDGDITLENGQYWYWRANTQTKDFDKIPLSIVTGRQPVAYSDVQKIDTNIITYNYYYRVKNVYFCCVSKDSGNNSDDFQYFGWYYPSYPQNQDVYIKVNADDGKVPTHYISDAEYKLTPEKGEFDFIPGDGETQVVQVNHMYYKGGYTNHDWFKKFVFHLSDSSDEAAKKQFDDFNIEVDTITAEIFNEMYGSTSMSVSEENTEAAGIADGNITENNDIVDEPETNAEETEADMGTDDISDTEEQSEGETSEVDSMISEAGVELVSIENELSDDTANVFKDGTDSANATENMETQEAEVSDSDILSADAADSTFSDGDSDECVAFSAGDTGTLKNELSEYDLIYLNGGISDASLRIMGSIPLIVNESKLESNADLQAVLSTYRNLDDVDGHYVNKYIYFFKNTLQNGLAGNLMNTTFHTTINSSDNITDDNDPAKGFEEILDYIETENKFRSLGETLDGTFNDGEKIDPLDTDISQARAIEYIINYKYKRVINSKTTFNALEIEPSKSSGQVSEGDVLNWLNDGKTDNDLIDTDNIKVCCYHKGEGVGDNRLFDNNADTIWHSAYDVTKNAVGNNVFDSSINKDDYYVHAQGKANSKHWMEIPLKYAVNIDGFWYQARKSNGAGSENGVLAAYTMVLYDKNDNVIDTISGYSGLNRNNIDRSKIKISFGRTVKNVKKMKLIFDDTFGNIDNNTNVFASCAEFGLISSTVTNMTAAEFVGHIDDIMSEYDMIYIGDDATKRNGFLNGMGDMLYAHVGAAKVVDKTNIATYSKLLGQLDNEYDLTWSGNETYKKRFAPMSTYSEDGAGYFRGSGNDMTKQECQELINYVKSGYPVVLGNTLILNEGDKRKVNTQKVDSSSYYYEFLKEAIKYENVVTRSEVEKDGKINSFFSTLAKPVIQFANNGRPPEPARLDENINGTGSIDQELKYVFTIENDSDATPAVSTYDCKLYIDLNFDGNLSEKEAQDKYLTITDSKGNVMSQVSYGKNDQRYELKLGEQYTVIRKIPAQYYKLITWKLVVSNNSNKYIHTSEIGYAKQSNSSGKKQVINVLQIKPDTGCKWDLNTVNNNNIVNENLKKKLEKIPDFDIKIKSVTVSELSAENSEINIFDYQILIIGFNDVYQDIPADKVAEIKKYIQSGRSVIFSHDTTSYLSYKYGYRNKENHDEGKYSDVYPKIALTKYREDERDIFFDGYLNGDNVKSIFNPSWGISMNNILRSIVGMDRYGITLTDKNVSGQTISSLLKQGHPLSSENTDFDDLLKYAGDIAYKLGDESRSTSYAQTQAFSNGLFLTDVNLGGGARTKVATKVNDGAITQYPYRIADTLNVSETHGQYYQLALEQDMDINGKSDAKTDIVVWYCLGGSIYGDSPNDARNYYYYYSKGNVIYTGTGHSDINNNEAEIQLFINSIVAAANVTATEPDVTFIKSLNPVAEKETTRYYTTDQPIWSQESNTLEEDMELYFNVKDYNMVSADLNQDDLDKQEMTVQLYIESPDGSELTGDELPANITGKKLKNITAEVGKLKEYNETETQMVNVASDEKFHLKQNNAYGFKISGIEKYLRDTQNVGTYKNKKVYVLVTSTVYLYSNEVSTSSVAVLDLKQRQLFDLD